MDIHVKKAMTPSLVKNLEKMTCYLSLMNEIRSESHVSVSKHKIQFED